MAFRFFRNLLIFLPLLAGMPAYAQQPYGFEFATDTRVVVGADTVPQPWVGGFNSASFSKIELNGDGVEDLYVHDHTSQRHLTFVAENGPGGWRWRHAPAYETAFPADNVLAVLLRDYDGDGRKDYFAVLAPQYIELYRNVPVPSGVGFEFQPVTFRLQQNDGFGGTRPVSTSIYGMLTIADFDGDADLDLLDYAYGQDIMTLYRNASGPGTAAPVFDEEQQWGDFVRCAGGGQACHTYAFSGTFCRPGQPAHGANRDYSLQVGDLDGDGDFDLLTGEQYCRDLALLQNRGTVVRPSFDNTSLVVPFPAGPPAASFIHTPAAFYQDVTFDGQPDLLVTPWLTGLEVSAFPFAGDQYDARESAWLYARTGPGLAAFSFQKTDFLQDQMLDLGNQAAPALGDLDGDGDLDLLVGSLADFVPIAPPLVGYASFKAQLRFYRNVGTLQRAVFRLEDEDFGQFSQLDKRALVPVLTDLDGNGTADLVVRYNDDPISNIAGTRPLSYILNTAPTGQLAVFPHAGLRPFQFSQASTSFRDLPCFYDVDGDGDRDMLLGTYQSNTVLKLIRNQGGTPETAFVLDDPMFGRVPLFYTGLSPAVGDFNGDGQAEVLTADDSGELRVWPDLLTSPTVPTSTIEDLVRNEVSGTFGLARLGTRPVVTTGDLNGDGRLEVMIGSAGGGVRLLRHQSQGGMGVDERAARAGLVVFPNPASDRLTVQLAAGQVRTVELVDMLGWTVPTANRGGGGRTIDVSSVRAGLYMLQVRTTDGRQLVRRVVVAH